MKNLFEEYGLFIVAAFMAMFLFFFGMAALFGENGVSNFFATPPNVEQSNLSDADAELPIIEVKNKVILEKGSDFDPTDYITKATEADGTPIDVTQPGRLSYSGAVDTSKRGPYNLKYILYSEEGYVSTCTVTFIVD